MQQLKERNGLGLIQTILSVIFLIGMGTFLAPCGPTEDGTWMHCHLAGQGLLLIAAILTLLSVLSWLVRSVPVRRVLEILKIGTALVGILLPGTLISLCMMPEMRCRSVMRPGATIFCFVLLVTSILGLLLSRRRMEQA